VLDERVDEMIELLKNGASNGALNESITAGSDLIREAQCTLDGIASNPYADALFSSATRCARCSINFASDEMWEGP